MRMHKLGAGRASVPKDVDKMNHAQHLLLCHKNANTVHGFSWMLSACVAGYYAFAWHWAAALVVSAAAILLMLAEERKYGNIFDRQRPAGDMVYRINSLNLHACLNLLAVGWVLACAALPFDGLDFWVRLAGLSGAVLAWASPFIIRRAAIANSRRTAQYENDGA